ncbi:MAG: Do family serine endopeptidase [Alphaproteobacteria bacterium]|nr:Do family serine endopeptidase [Alphaproteobacteria bacterium]
MKKLIALIISFLLMTPTVKAQKTEILHQSFAPLVEKLLPGVVNISTLREDALLSEKPDIISANEFINEYFLQDEGGRTSLGSGFIIDTKGYIITNNHVIDKASEIMVKLSDDRQFNAEVIGTDKLTDLALIKINSDEVFPFVKMGDSDAVRVGDWILAIGNPFGLGGSVTSGIVSAKSRDIDAGSYDNFIQTDASINQGSSGGPLFNMDGEVIGINTAIFSSTGNSVGIGFATPINLSKFVVEQLISKGKVERGWLGLKVVSNNQDITISDSQIFKGGVVVNSLNENSPALQKGIEAGDIIISMNGNDVKDAKSFSRNVAETPIGKDVILRIWRNGQTKDITLTVSSMPETTAKEPKNTVDITIDEKPKGYIEELGIVADEANGAVVITEVLADSDAYTKGLKSGNIIQRLDGKDVSSIDDLKAYVAYAKNAGGPPVEVKISDNGLLQTIHLKVSADD